MPNDPLLRLWGKTSKDNPDRYHPLLYHLLDVAAVAQALLSEFGSIAGLPDTWSLYLIALHDIGKADARFQLKAGRESPLVTRLIGLGLPFPTQVEPGFRHEALSAWWLRDHLAVQHRWQRDAVNAICASIRGHHGNFRAPLADTDDYGRVAHWEPLRQELAASVAQALQLDSLCLNSFADASETGMRLAGLTVLADWIASNEETYRYWEMAGRAGMRAPAADYLALAREEAQHAVARLRLTPVARPGSAAPPFREVWPEIARLRPAQEAMESVCLADAPPGLVMVESDTGSGKTECAVYLAECWNRMARRTGAYIALPTMATSNQMHVRYERHLRRQHPEGIAPRLIHGMAWLLDEDAPNRTANTDSDEDEEQLSREWFRNAKRALIAPEGVGTIDQALMAALNVKHGFLRLFGLSPRTLIVDEVHAYDQYMTVLLERLLQWCRALHIPVILLSATLSRRQKERLVSAYRPDAALPAPPPDGEEPYPLLTFVPERGEPFVVPVAPGSSRAVRVRPHAGLLEDTQATAQLAVDLVRDGGCACVLANMVRDAQDIFQKLDAMELADTRLILFHARFPAWRRQEIEDEVTRLFGKGPDGPANPERPERAILVATQVVEQSLDVDFDVIVTQLAPIDLLLQRAGRLHRHERGARPTGAEAELHILLPAQDTYEFGVTGKVYSPPEALLRTLALLHGRDTIVLPRDYRPLVEGCYSDRPLGEHFPADLLADARQKSIADDVKAQQQASLHLIPEPNPRVFVYAQQPKPVNEADENSPEASFFHAQTRRQEDGQETRAVLVLHDPDLVAMARRERPPDRNTLRKLFLHRAQVPGFWFRDLAPDSSAFEGARWLRGHLVVPMPDGEWRAQTATGDQFVIRDLVRVGIVRASDSGD